jgi:hypothetical protein
MDTPPFPLSRLASGRADATPRQPLLDRCCEPVSTAQPPAARRARLAELDMHLHCSVIGTCLSTAELRKLVPRHADIDREQATDLQIHHTAVELAVQGGDGAKALHKALDQRYAAAIKRFAPIKDLGGLRAGWREALKTGDVPPAYWAVMTHPVATLEIRQLAFGDVHMLSHLVGAANRADIRRLVALEEDNAQLKHKIERQQSRFQAFALERDAELRALRVTLDAWRAAGRRDPDTEDPHAEVERLRAALDERNDAVAQQAERCATIERRLKEEQARVQLLRTQLQQTYDQLDALRSEAQAMEQAVARTAADTTGDDDAAPLDAVRGKRIVYVGGRPGATAAIRRLVEAAGGSLNLHDGGIEDRKGRLAALVPGADLVVFPVDCVDHDSMNTLKRLCERHGVIYHPLRTASVASFVDRVMRAPDGIAGAAGCGRAPALCLRHG